MLKRLLIHSYLILITNNPLFIKKWISFLTFFLLALTIRLILFNAVWHNLKHGSSGTYGSGAVGLYKEGKFTTTREEKDQIYDSGNMNKMNFLDLYDSRAPRTPQTIFLPGPGFLLFILWKLFPVYNFTVLIILQAVLESLLIGLIFILFSGINKPVALITACVLVFNIFIIRLTLSAGYDFWPVFTVMVYFAGLLYLIRTPHIRKIRIVLLATGILGGFTIWCREITTPLSALMCIAVPALLYRKSGKKLKSVAVTSAYFILPTLIILASLSLYRYRLVDNIRPTRSTFWHTMWSGILCYKNPYIEKPNPLNDKQIWEFGKKLDPELNNYTLEDMYELPDSPYEKALKKEYFIFIKEHPLIFARNFIYRTATILSPPFYTGGEHITRTQYVLLMSAGVFFLILWILGIIFIYRENRDLFFIIIFFFAAFIIPFGLTALMGRVMLVHLFINVIVYLSGIAWILYRIVPGLAERKIL